ncbi:MAG: EF-Tu/IF-2/RF-3 family GTPase [Candidatus Bathyarchaeia archaeon]|jgi:selenocysteine-specific translation elongation factor
MQHLTVGVFHDDTLTRELGKKATESDIVMSNRKMDDCIFSFMSPVADKLSAKSQIISTIDTAVVAFSQMTRELGETILMLDLMGVKSGIAITTSYATPDQIGSITKNTAINSFKVEPNNPGRILELLKSINPKRDNASPPVIVVDHSFSVKGVGEVVLGFVKQGTVRKYDKLNLLPSNKEVIVRSIQIQDEDWETADAGTRVGLAIKGATIDELGRGSVLTTSTDIKADSKLKINFQKSSFYAEEVKEGSFHATIGMQTTPITISEISDNSLVIESPNPIVHAPQETLLLLDLNAKKTRIIGKGTL